MSDFTFHFFFVCSLAHIELGQTFFSTEHFQFPNYLEHATSYAITYKNCCAGSAYFSLKAIKIYR
jgi:hypothetical protein